MTEMVAQVVAMAALAVVVMEAPAVLVAAVMVVLAAVEVAAEALGRRWPLHQYECFPEFPGSHCAP